MKKEELERMDKGHKILNDIEELKNKFENVENTLSRGKIVKGVLVVIDEFNNSERVSLSSRHSELLLIYMKHTLQHDINELEKEFEEL